MNYKITKYRVVYNPSGLKNYTIQAYVVFEEEKKTKSRSKTTTTKWLEDEGEWYGWNKKTHSWEFGTLEPRCYFRRASAQKAIEMLKLYPGW